MGLVTRTSDWKIEQGPSKMDLMLAVFDHRSSRKRPVLFSLRGRKTGDSEPRVMHMYVVISQVKRTDSDGDSWHFMGKPTTPEGDVSADDCEQVEGKFYVKDRTGCLKLTETYPD